MNILTPLVFKTPPSSPYIFSVIMGVDDDDAPPMLVDVEGQEGKQAEEKAIKVPITIVTGKPCTPLRSMSLIRKSQAILGPARQRS